MEVGWKRLRDGVVSGVVLVAVVVVVNSECGVNVVDAQDDDSGSTKAVSIRPRLPNRANLPVKSSAFGRKGGDIGRG